MKAESHHHWQAARSSNSTAGISIRTNGLPVCTAAGYPTPLAAAYPSNKMNQIIKTSIFTLILLSRILSQPDPGEPDIISIGMQTAYNITCSSEVSIDRTNDTGIYAFSIQLVFDSEILTIDDVCKTDRLIGEDWLILTEPMGQDTLSIGCTGIYGITPGVGPILDITFSYPQNLEPLVTELNLIQGIVCNEYTSWEVQVEDGSLTIMEYDYPLGDVNNDLSVDILDVLDIVQSIIHNNVVIDFLAADCACDGVIDILDIVSLVNVILLFEY